ncbi:hypothetical protein RIR_jg23023.t1 [Rhizophagus irregularis DAOM 181602=DAOM 197198]|nr:hypothetical protein RIR_jg23023.t1 [Rhizophagus irregularis DAOM 181602=DAOM 197198]
MFASLCFDEFLVMDNDFNASSTFSQRREQERKRSEKNGKNEGREEIKKGKERVRNSSSSTYFGYDALVSYLRNYKVITVISGTESKCLLFLPVCKFCMILVLLGLRETTNLLDQESHTLKIQVAFF